MNINEFPIEFHWYISTAYTTGEGPGRSQIRVELVKQELSPGVFAVFFVSYVNIEFVF